MYVFSVASRRGFTLIELLIVPGVIGLIGGGMLAGQSQIKSRAIRAQISQIVNPSLRLDFFRADRSRLPLCVRAAGILRLPHLASGCEKIHLY